MQSVRDELSLLRGGQPMMLDHHNRSRYRVVVQETDGTKTAYYFSTPIYNQKSRKLLDLCFFASDGVSRAIGSNADIAVADDIRLQNDEGYCRMTLPQKPTAATDREVRCGADKLWPTTNGVALKVSVKNTRAASFLVEVGKPFMSIRANDKCFSLMSERFRPFVTVSCIGTQDACGKLIAPATLEYQKLTDRKYQLMVSPSGPMGTHVLLEINLYEPKLLQDTTVESRSPHANNAFGSVAFIGNTALFGEQWLYSRWDSERLSDVMSKRINHAVLHLPKHSTGSVELSAYTVSTRFCSFGSNWENKKAESAFVSHSVAKNGYQSLTVTDAIADPITRTFKRSEGLILRSKRKGNGFSAVSTGDSYYAPQILQINFK